MPRTVGTVTSLPAGFWNVTVRPCGLGLTGFGASAGTNRGNEDGADGGCTIGGDVLGGTVGYGWKLGAGGMIGPGG